MFAKKNIKDVPVEETPHATGARKMLVDKDETSSIYFEAHTYGYLPAGMIWKMHKHDNIVEICVVTKGRGLVRDAERNEEDFIKGDVFIFPANTEHEIENNTDQEAEFYFLRIKDK